MVHLEVIAGRINREMLDASIALRSIVALRRLHRVGVAVIQIVIVPFVIVAHQRASLQCDAAGTWGAREAAHTWHATIGARYHSPNSAS